MGAYATVDDMIALGVELTAAQTTAAEILLDTASAKLRLLGGKYGVDVDTEVEASEDYALVVKNIVVRAVTRAINTMADTSDAVTQTSQSAMGYSVSMTYSNPGQSLYFLKSELKDLGLIKQRYGGVTFYATDD